MTLAQVDEILINQKRVFNFENELVMHFALELILKHDFAVNNIYFEKTFDVQYHKQTTGLPHDEKESYFDLVAIKNGKRIGFELKYCTSKFDMVDDNKMKISLKAQSANDIIRFGFRKDIYRIEHLIQKKEIDIGFVILLTNDKNLFNTNIDTGYLDANYRFTDKIEMKDYGWNNSTYPENHWTKKGDKDFMLHLLKSYSVTWKKNSCIQSDFRFCSIEIT